MAEKENKEIKRAMNTLDFISEDPKERERHNSIIMAEYNRLTSEHNFFEAGKEERKERTERKNGIKQTAKKLIKMKIPVEQVIEATGLTREEIENIRKT